MECYIGYKIRYNWKKRFKRYFEGEYIMNLLLLGFARENSVRVKKKLIRPFADTTLTYQ